MAYVDYKGYCDICKVTTEHRFSRNVMCLNCGKMSSHGEFKKLDKAYQEELSLNKTLSGSASVPEGKKRYHIWAEGFRMTGDSGQARYMGEVYASNFKEACETLFKGNHLFDATRMTHWGCELFDNEADARRRFG